MLEKLEEMIVEMQKVNQAIVKLKKEKELLAGENILLKKEVVRLKWILERQD